MTLCQNKDLLSTVQVSYLWNDNEQSSSNVGNVSKQDLNISNELSQSNRSRLSMNSKQAPMKSPKHVRVKEITAISLSEMHLAPKGQSESHASFTPNISTQVHSQVPIMIEPSSKVSRLACLSKNGKPICQCRWTTIAFGVFILILCAIAIVVPIAFNLKGPNTISTTTTTTTTSSTSTTSTTSTTTTPPATLWIPSNYNDSCLYTCANVSTVTPATLIVSWTFEQNANDVSGNSFHGQIINGAAFTTGYIGQAIEFQSNSTQFVNAPYINLVNRSFTVEAWIKLYNLRPNGDLSILSQCETNVPRKCLHYVIRQNRPYMDFFIDDIIGRTNLTTSIWYHIAYVYDFSSNIKTIYLNGLSDRSSTDSGTGPSLGSYLGENGNTTIGSWTYNPLRGWDGLIDQLTISNRAKTPCEVLNDASLVAHFTFDGNYNDIGPKNSMIGTSNPQVNNGLSWITGRVNQALSFNSSNSYFQSCGYYALGMNQPFSIAMWIQPSFQSGTLFHLSSSGTGSGVWCLPMIGFTSNGSLIVQTWTGITNFIMGPILPINMWTHIVLTYSSINGLRLYLNGGLYGSIVVNTFSSSSLPMCVLLASSGLGTNCQTSLLAMGHYSGAIDEFYIYNRELNDFEVCPLAHP